LRWIETGESITNRGKAITDLVPSSSSRREKAKYAIDNRLKMTKSTVSDDVLQTLKGSDR